MWKYRFILRKFYFFYLILLYYNSYAWEIIDNNDSTSNIPKIAIIGGGIGGTSAAYFLHKLFDSKALLDLYEAGPIGGRLATIAVDNLEYETGGSILHPKNHYMLHFLNTFGIEKRKSCGDGTLGIYNGKNYDFVTTGSTIGNIWKLFWKYGWKIFKLQSDISYMLDDFSKIYKSQEEGKTFTSIEDLLAEMNTDFPKLLHKPCKQFLQENGYSDSIINQFVTAVTRANYGQLPGIHAFVCSVALAGTGGDLWAVNGGNKKIPENLLTNSQATLVKRMVHVIVLTPEHKFVIYSSEEGKPQMQFSDRDDDVVFDADNFASQEYDAVIVATPLTKDKASFSFVNFTDDFSFPGSYEHITATLVKGQINGTEVGFDDAEKIVDEILTDESDLIYNSIGRQQHVSVMPTDCNVNGHHIYKIFSSKPLSDSQLSLLFEQKDDIHITNWFAYPHYSLEEDKSEEHKFELVPGLYYNNAVELAASAMEMSAIAAKNSALLIYKYINGKVPFRQRPKDEL